MAILRKEILATNGEYPCQSCKEVRVPVMGMWCQECINKDGKPKKFARRPTHQEPTFVAEIQVGSEPYEIVEGQSMAHLLRNVMYRLGNDDNAIESKFIDRKGVHVRFSIRTADDPEPSLIGEFEYQI